MTPKIEAYLENNPLPTPCLVFDLDAMEERFRRLRRALPLAEIYYAVKANPVWPVLDRLVSLGSRFDAASIGEIDACLDAGAAPGAISFGNTIKKSADIARARDLGLDLFAFDTAEEVDKLADHAPGARVYCRLGVDNGGADWPLSRKFGCSAETAVDLLIRAREKGLDPHGVSFHVGSQQTDPSRWQAAIGRAAMVFTDLQARGIGLKMLNLGGGYPARYRSDVPDVAEIGDAILDAMHTHFGNRMPDMILEPGRCIVAEAGVMETEVVLAARRDPEDPYRWVYLDAGKFGGLAETMGEAIRYDLRTPHDGTPTGPVKIAGPTCDGADILYEEAGYELPLALTTGDRVRVLAAGAYTATYASRGFNGFQPPYEVYL